MSALREEYAPPSTNFSTAVRENIYGAQSFLTTSIYYLTSFKVRMAKSGTPGGNFIGSIRAVGGDGKVTGPDLASGSIPVSGIITGLNEITMETPLLITNDTLYALVFGGPSGDSNNYVGVRGFNPGGYGNGRAQVSTDYGATWTLYATDYEFQVWGEGLGQPYIIRGQHIPGMRTCAGNTGGN
ncbi:MAG: hypothetical protein WC551_08060 [Patescibacteria group bacterium]